MSSKIAIKERPNVSLNVISSKLSRVFDASAASSITLGAGNNVTTWINVAPNAVNGTNATQTVSANQPVYDAVNRRINFGSGISSRFLNFEGFGGSNFTGSIYIGTNAGVYAYDINVPSGSPNSWEWGRRETNIFVTGIVITNTVLTTTEENIVNRWLATRGSIGLINYSALGITSLSLRFNSYNFNNGVDLGNTLHRYVTQSKYIPYSSNVTNMTYAHIGNTRLQNFPFYDTALVVAMVDMCSQCTGLTSVPQINTQSLVNADFTWYICSSLVNFPPLNFIVTTSFNATWYTDPLSQLSLDNILISIAAGLSNNPNKNIVTNSDTFSAVVATPTNTNRRVAESDWQTWETTNNTGLSGTAIRNLNATYGTGANAVTYNFSNGITGQQARLWMIAFSAANNKNPAWNFITAVPAAPAGIARGYLFAAFGTSISITTNLIAPTTGSTGSGNASIFNLVGNRTTHGLGTIQGQTNSGLILSGFSAGTHTIFVATTQGYYNWTQSLATSTTYRWTGEQSGILNIMIVTGEVTSGSTTFNQIIDRLTYYGALVSKTKNSTNLETHSLTVSSLTSSHEASYISFLNTRYTGTEATNGELIWLRNSGTGSNTIIHSVQGNTQSFTTTTATLSGVNINTINLSSAPIQLAGDVNTTFHVGTTSNRYSITPNFTSNYQALNYFWTGSWGDDGVRAIVQRASSESLSSLNDISTMFTNLNVGNGTTSTAAVQNYPLYTAPFANQSLQSRTVSSASGTSITLDSTVTLNSNTHYNLHADTHVLNGSISSSTTSSVTVASGVTLQSQTSYRITVTISNSPQTRLITNNAGSGITTITVSPNFSAAPTGSYTITGTETRQVTTSPGTTSSITISSAFTTTPNASAYVSAVTINSRLTNFSPTPTPYVTPTTQTIGSSISGYWGGVLAPNGRIYCVPTDSSRPILEITPLPGGGATTQTIGSFSGYIGGVLAPNGRIYCMPYFGGRPILEITPLPGGGATTQTIGSFSGYHGGVLAPNGRIYCMPYTASTPILEITPLPGGGATTQTIGSFSGYIGGVLAPNGRIYCVPNYASAILEITPLPGGGATTQTIGSFSGYVGGVLAPNGRIYYMPYWTSTPILEINVGAPSDWVNTSRDFLLHASLNKF